MMMEDSREVVFILGDKLPTYYDAAVAIFSVVTKPKSIRRNEQIHAYYLVNASVWIKAFGKQHVMTRKSITNKLVKLIENSSTLVYKKSRHTDQSHSSTQSPRKLNKTWRSSFVNEKLGIRYSSLLDIGRDMQALTGDDKIFYDDQKSDRLRCISSGIDVEYEVEQGETRGGKISH